MIWYNIVQHYTRSERIIDKKYGREERTKWFDVDDTKFARTKLFSPMDLLEQFAEDAIDLFADINMDRNKVRCRRCISHRSY